MYDQKIASSVARDAGRREAFLLAQLQTIPEWRGNLIHHVLATDFCDRLRYRQAISATSLVNRTVELAAKQWDFSAKNRFREQGMVKTAQGDQYCALMVHEADQVTPDRVDVMEDIRGFAADCFDNLLAQDELMSKLKQGHGFVAEHQILFPFIGDTTVRATPDLVCQSGSTNLLIVDWKVVDSETDDYATQLYLYALAVLRSVRWPEVKPENITLYEANLFQGKVRPYFVTQTRIADTEDFVYDSIQEMKALLGDASKDDFQLDDYEAADKATTCQCCVFLKRCRHDIATSNSQAVLDTYDNIPQRDAKRKLSKTKSPRMGSVHTSHQNGSLPVLLAVD